MAIAERRKHTRSPIAKGESVFVEIRHTFGPIKKSVYKVLDLDEFGMSFLVPVEDGYFALNTPLQYTIVNTDLSRTDGAGFVRHYQHYGDGANGLYYKIGVEASARYRDNAGGNYFIRPRRHNLDGKEYARAIVFEVDGRQQPYELIDISRYSAAFRLDSKDSTAFGLSRVVGPVRIVIDKNIVYEGSVMVTRVYDDAQSRRRVVVEPRGRLFDIDVIEEYEALSLTRREIAALARTHDAYARVDGAYKALIADLRGVLEDYRRLCESPRLATGHDDQRTILEEMAGPFSAQVDSCMTRLDGLVADAKLDEEQRGTYRTYFQKHLMNLILSSPVNHRAYFKPEGYPGDYETIRLIHQDGFTGTTPFAKLMNYYTVSVSAAMVARKRTEYLAERIRAFVERSPKERVEILSIACGPALEMDLLMKRHPRVTDRISLTLLDQEIHALQFAQDNLYAQRITHESTMKIELIHSGIEGLLRRAAEKQHLSQFDLVYAFGLFDYFDRQVARFVIRHVLSMIAPGGMLIVSNVSLDGLEHRTYAEYGLEWYLVYRSRSDMEDLAAGMQGCSHSNIDEIERGIMKFLELTV